MHSDFKDKPIYVKGKELYVLVNKVMTSKTPYPLKDQILRAAISIVLNFSEGYGRFTNKDKKKAPQTKLWVSFGSGRSPIV